MCPCASMSKDPTRLSLSSFKLIKEGEEEREREGGDWRLSVDEGRVMVDGLEEGGCVRGFAAIL